MRLFVALQPSPYFLSALAETQDRLRSAGVEGRYLAPENLHMTLAFIGEWPEDVTAQLPSVEKPFPLVLSHLGTFPEADVLWAGVQASEELYALAGKARAMLAAAGIPFDTKRFTPHITLARKPSVPKGIILSELAIPAAEMTVNEVCLYRSERGRNGMAYTVIARSRNEYGEGRSNA